MNNTKQTKVVYVMKYAMNMIALGHKLVAVLDNPQSQGYNLWVFEDDDTFESDLKEVIVRNRRG